MLDWLTAEPVDPERLTIRMLIIRLFVALVCGIFVAVVYRLSHGRDRRATSGLVTTLVLLAVLISLVSVVIGGSVARAFSLVGALSIVRFRTVVEDTRDTAFVIFTVIAGMAAGAGLFAAAGCGLLIVGATAITLSHFWDRPDVLTEKAIKTRLVVKFAMGHQPHQLIGSVLEEYFSQTSIRETCTIKQGAGIEVTYDGRLKDQSQLPIVVTALSQVEGVTGVELRRD